MGRKRTISIAITNRTGLPYHFPRELNYIYMEKFTLINKDRSRIKVFEPFEDVSKPSPSIDAMMISYGCVYKRSSKPVMKGSRVETIETARKEYAKLLKEGWKKTSIFNSYF